MKQSEAKFKSIFSLFSLFFAIFRIFSLFFRIFCLFSHFFALHISLRFDLVILLPSEAKFKSIFSLFSPFFRFFSLFFVSLRFFHLIFAYFTFVFASDFWCFASKWIMWNQAFFSLPSEAKFSLQFQISLPKRKWGRTLLPGALPRFEPEPVLRQAGALTTTQHPLAIILFSLLCCLSPPLTFQSLWNKLECWDKSGNPSLHHPPPPPPPHSMNAWLPTILPH